MESVQPFENTPLVNYTKATTAYQVHAPIIDSNNGHRDCNSQFISNIKAENTRTRIDTNCTTDDKEQSIWIRTTDDKEQSRLTRTTDDNEQSRLTRTTDDNEQSRFTRLVALSRRKKFVLVLCTLAMFLTSLAFSLLGPFFPSEAMDKGMDMGLVGFVYGIYQVAIFMTSPFFGCYLVKLGPRFVFFTGMFIGGSCNLLFGTLQYCPSGTPFIAMSILIRFVEAVGFSGFITSCYAIVSSEFKENVGFTFGILETGSGLGYMVGPTLGGALYELGGFSLPFFSAGVAVFLNGIAVYTFLPKTEELPVKRKGSMMVLFMNPLVSVPLFCGLTSTMSITAYDATYAKRLEPMEFSVGIVGILFGVVAFLYSIMSSIWGYVSDAKDVQAPLIIVGQLVSGIAFFVMGPSFLFPFIPFNLVTIVIGLVCIGVSFGSTLVPTMKCMMNGAIEMGFDNNIDTYALVSGLYTSVKTLGGFVGPVGVGFLIQELDFSVAYTVVGMCHVFMAVVSLIFFTHRNLNTISSIVLNHNNNAKGESQINE